MSEGVEVDVVDALEELGGPGVGQGLGQPVAPGLVLGLQGPEFGQGRRCGARASGARARRS